MLKLTILIATVRFFPPIERLIIVNTDVWMKKFLQGDEMTTRSNIFQYLETLNRTKTVQLYFTKAILAELTKLSNADGSNEAEKMKKRASIHILQLTSQIKKHCELWCSTGCLDSPQLTTTEEQVEFMKQKFGEKRLIIHVSVEKLSAKLTKETAQSAFKEVADLFD